MGMLSPNWSLNAVNDLTNPKLACVVALEYSKVSVSMRGAVERLSGDWMIIDQVEMLKRYVRCTTLFGNVADHLPDATSLADGKYPIIDDELFVIIETRTGMGKSGAVLESHRKYIDVQVPLAGTGVVWLARCPCVYGIARFQA